MGKFGGFGGGGGMMNMQQMMKQAQKMQEEMLKAQQELEDAEIEGNAGGDMVSVILNGKKRLLSITIKPEAIDPDDAEMLEDLIVAAFNDAFEKADEMEKELSPTGGLF